MRKAPAGRFGAATQSKGMPSRLMWRASSFLPVKGAAAGKVEKGRRAAVKEEKRAVAPVKQEKRTMEMKDEGRFRDAIRYVSGQDKPWVCLNCNRNYKWRNSLVCHLKNECGVPPKYYCSYMCGYKTNILSNLRRHVNAQFCNNAKKQLKHEHK
uniref:C2H2-type domain-containing protein n=1 Tax=Lutzomyia longipalpis TaxID=7200 RepID=A0A1B0CHH3_LUTLO